MRRTVWIALILFVACVMGTYVAYYCRTALRAGMTVGYLGDVSEAFFVFRDRHGRWPQDLQEVSGDEYCTESITDDCKDVISNLPFDCVAYRERYYVTEGERVHVLVMLTRPYRTALPPFGKLKTMVLTEDGVIRVIATSKVIDRGHVNGESGG